MHWLWIIAFVGLLTVQTNGLDTSRLDKWIKSFWKEPYPGHPDEPAAPPNDLLVIIADTSRYFHNYRHVSNAMAFYRIVKWLGVPDHQILLMLGECSACDPRNPFRGELFLEADHRAEIWQKPGLVDVDFLTSRVYTGTLMNILTDRSREDSLWSQRLTFHPNANVLLFINGHGGDQFTKFQDFDELSSEELSEAIHQLYLKNGFRQFFMMVDSCQALTLSEDFVTPNVMGLGSSLKDENAYSCNEDARVGQSLMDRFSFLTAKMFESFQAEHMNITVKQYMDQMDPVYLMAPPGVRDDLMPRSSSRIRLLEYLGHPKVVPFHERVRSKRRRRPYITEAPIFSHA